MSSSKISVMIVDDSPTARRILTDIINRHPQMEVLAAVADPFEAVPELKRKSPVVMILDVQIPRMDGITFLKKLMTIQPLPVVMCSSFTERGSSVLRRIQRPAMKRVTRAIWRFRFSMLVWG